MSKPDLNFYTHAKAREAMLDTIIEVSAGAWLQVLPLSFGINQAFPLPHSLETLITRQVFSLTHICSHFLCPSLCISHVL